MKTITIITGNPGKLKEWQAMLPENSDINFVIHKLDLPEIQSLDSKAIVKDKLERAYKILKTPIVLEDVSAGLDNLGGLPGPFFKFFEDALGPTALLQVAGKPGEPATITCTVGYFDGKEMIFTTGTTHATVVEPRGTGGFGFDAVVLADGQTRTNAELSPEEKNAISHRGQAIKAMLPKLV